MTRLCSLLFSLLDTFGHFLKSSRLVWCSVGVTPRNVVSNTSPVSTMGATRITRFMHSDIQSAVSPRWGIVMSPAAGTGTGTLRAVILASWRAGRAAVGGMPPLRCRFVDAVGGAAHSVS